MQSFDLLFTKQNVIMVVFLIILFFFKKGLESCLKGPDNYNSQVLIEATVIALTKLQPLLNKVNHWLFESTENVFCTL